jgi:putative ABC transport system permease protein
MYQIAKRILLGDTAKYFGLIFGITFATLLMSQQVSIFIGLMLRTANVIFEVSEADIWVMDKRVRYIEEVEPLRDIELTRVRSIPGVKWAVPFYKGLATIRMKDGLTQQVQLIGVDYTSLVGAARNIVKGDVNAIRQPENAMMDVNGYNFTWPNLPLELGRQVELNDHRLKIMALSQSLPTFYTFPILYVSYARAKEILPSQRNFMSFVLATSEKGMDPRKVAADIENKTGLQALTQNEFAWRSIQYILQRTGIPINFFITVFLGILIGGAITAQTFYLFVTENQREFAAMKAIGFTNSQLLGIVLIQAIAVSLIGYSFGIGLTSLFFSLTSNVPALKGFFLPWQVMVGSAIIIGVISLFSIFLSLRRVFKIDPAVVFRG